MICKTLFLICVDMTTNRRKEMSKQNPRIIKRGRSKNVTFQAAIKAGTKSSPATPSTVVSMLLQPPKKWTPGHLKAARLKLSHNFLLSTIAGDYVPRDIEAGLLFFTRIYHHFLVKDRDHGLSPYALFSITKGQNTN